MRIFLKSKLHKAIVTEANLAYTGSITIDKALMEAADLAEYEKVLVVDNTNGNRLETYAIAGDRHSGVVCMNGAAAHLVRAGDEITIMSFHLQDKPTQPIKLLLDANNRIFKNLTQLELVR
ncbi:aspartate 1-decarboxylase [Synechococcus sp. PCC 7336]|uniref:aspartate 1-decarboxylase n=1 Tax=Synechococcus sp. PCC 7336 TaxID=195250 RepID=UPI00034C611C|nr:aspartate 1-decarboxylase [Synechococcus sp. PCC 7336]